MLPRPSSQSSFTAQRWSVSQIKPNGYLFGASQVALLQLMSERHAWVRLTQIPCWHSVDASHGVSSVHEMTLW
jgi:hypothetical protein